MESLGFGRYQLILFFLVGIATMADTVELMLVAVLSPELECYWNLSSIQTAAIAATMYLANCVGCIFWGILADKKGRKPILILSMSISFAFNVFVCLSPSYTWFIILRMFGTFGTAGYYQSWTILVEATPLKLRGRITVLLFIFWSLGAITCSSLGFVISGMGWQYFLLFNTMPTALFLSMSYWLPESIRYLMTS